MIRSFVLCISMSSFSLLLVGMNEGMFALGSCGFVACGFAKSSALPVLQSLLRTSGARAESCWMFASRVVLVTGAAPGRSILASTLGSKALS